MKIVYLIKDNQEELWNNQNDYDSFFSDVGAPYPPKEHLQHIKEKGGEKIVYIDDKNYIIGWIGLIPIKNECELAGIETDRKYRNQRVASLLINEAEKYLHEKNITRLIFQTSPLLTENTLFYLMQNNTKYVYNNTVLVGEKNNIYWPVVDCIMELPKKRNQYIFNKNIPDVKSMVKWKEYKAEIDNCLLDNNDEEKYLILPYLNIQIIMKEMQEGNVEYLNQSNKVFQLMKERAYEIKSFVKYGEDYMYIFRKET